ncbi:MAG: ATP-binding protein [Treponema sp.]|nr:ATP-binding protein [Treponema sp.]
MDSEAQIQPVMSSNNQKSRAAEHVSIQKRIFLVTIIIALLINVCGLTVSTLFMTRSVRGAMENDLLVTVDIADMYVTKEIEFLKVRAADAAREIDQLYKAGRTEGVLELVHKKNPVYIGIGVFNQAGLVDSWGGITLSPDLVREPFMQYAAAGGQAVSTTMYSPDGSFVMYVSAPISGGLILAAVLPGLHFNKTVSRFIFWKTGHIFIDDAEGTVISNNREEWVQQRQNFIESARTNSEHEGMAAVLRRGIAGERGTGQFSIDGKPRLCAFRPVSSPNEGWLVGVIAPLSESSLHKIPFFIIMMSIITLVISVLGAVIASSLLKRPYDDKDRQLKEIETMSMLKSTFLANMSHEIRTPMNSIVGFSELAMDGEISHRTRDYLNKIQTNAKWLLQIINDILDISKVESGKMELENIPFDMHDLFTSCRTLIMPKAVEKGIALFFYAEPSIGKRPLGDPTRLRQVLVNLLSNAVKFTNKGMVKLNSIIKETNERDITVYFEVKDSGIGMTNEQIQKIFDPFTQAESGTTRKYGGTGLGLAITKNIVDLMGGNLCVESALGVGSKFSFELRFDTMNISDEELFEKKIIFNELEKPAFKGEVLLCEDNFMNQQVISEHLARVGLVTVLAENGRIGVDLVQKRKQKGEKQFDLIFMDMHMPEMDGLEAAEKILELNTGIPIVAMTANIMANDRDIYKMSGMNDCVGKPFTSQELWHCLMKYFTPVDRGNTAKNVQLETEMQYQGMFLKLFVKSNQNRYDEIVQALDDGDIHLAHRLAHTLKGNAGQIGKIVLQKAAADVELQLKEGKNNVTRDQLNVLKTELKAVLNEYASLVDRSEENQGKPDQKLSINPEKTWILFGKLEPLLKGGNSECMNFIKDLRAVTGSEQLIQYMEDYEFEQAAAKLAELKKNLVYNGL